jgi:hypothetical protein
MPKLPGKSKECSANAGKTRRLGKLLAELFRTHWRAVEVKLSTGIDVAKNRAPFFFASDSRQRLRTARRYYTPARAKKFASLSTSEILRLSDGWFGAFQTYLHYGWAERRQTRVELRNLVGAEYVAVSWVSPYTLDLSWKEKTADSLFDSPGVHPLPDESVYYGDVYEITAGGVSRGAHLRICKSVAEPFSEGERFQARAGIEREFFENSYADGEPIGTWKVNFRSPENLRLIEVDIVKNRKRPRTRPVASPPEFPKL